MFCNKWCNWELSMSLGHWRLSDLISHISVNTYLVVQCMDNIFILSFQTTWKIFSLSPCNLDIELNYLSRTLIQCLHRQSIYTKGQWFYSKWYDTVVIWKTILGVIEWKTIIRSFSHPQDIQVYEICWPLLFCSGKFFM